MAETKQYLDLRRALQFSRFNTDTRSVKKTFQILFRNQLSQSLGFFLFGVGATLFEGLGIALFLPLLRTASAPDASQSSEGNFLTIFFQLLGLVPTLGNTLLLIVAAFFIKGVLQFAQVKLRTMLLAQFGHRTREDFFFKLERLRLDYFDKQSKSSLSAMVSSEIVSASTAVQGFLNFIVRGLTTITLLGMALATNWRLTLLAMGAGAAVGLALRNLSKMSSRESKKLSENIVQFNQGAMKFIAAFRYIQGTSNFSYVQNKISNQLRQIQVIQGRISGYTALLEGLQQPMASLILASMIFISIHYLNYDLASIFVTLALIYKVLSQLICVQNEWQNFAANEGHLDRLLTELALMNTHSESRNASEEPFTLKNSIVFDDVSLTIGGKEILSRINMTIPRGKFIGIVGTSGSGKSTLVDLLTGLRTPTVGKILVDGKKMTDLSIQKLRNQIGLVNQEFALFSDNVVENVSLQLHDTHRAIPPKVEDALRMAHAWNFLKTGHDSDRPQTEHPQLSVGQRQRIAIAREIYRNPEILILDEATSALDTVSESLVQQAIESLAEHLTLIVVTHRLSNLKRCDLVYVLHEGKLIESGSFEELMNQPEGHFRNLVDNGSLDRAEPQPRIAMSSKIQVHFESSLPDNSIVRFDLMNISKSGVGIKINKNSHFKAGDRISGELILPLERIPCVLFIVHSQGTVAGGTFVSLSGSARDHIDQFIAEQGRMKLGA